MQHDATRELMLPFAAKMGLTAGPVTGYKAHSNVSLHKILVCTACPTCMTVAIWVATTDSTSTSIRLNSSRQAQAPVCARPANILPVILKSTPSLQLNTMT